MKNIFNVMYRRCILDQSLAKEKIKVEKGARLWEPLSFFCWIEPIRFGTVRTVPNSDWLIFKTSNFLSTTVPPGISDEVNLLWLSVFEKYMNKFQFF